MSFRRDSERRCSLLPGAYARGSKRSHSNGKKPVVDSKSQWFLSAKTHMSTALAAAKTLALISTLSALSKRYERQCMLLLLLN